MVYRRALGVEGAGTAEEVYRSSGTKCVVNDGLVYFLCAVCQLVRVIPIGELIHGNVVGIHHVGAANGPVKLVRIGLAGKRTLAE